MLPDAKPDLVVIDSNLPEAETSQLIARLKQEQYPLKLLVLAETTQQLNKANKSGADITLRSYSLPDKLDLVLGRVGIKPVDQ
jgi:DNA-binding NarL/FixJ family response regulator